jgi:O-6-methylguanine DNA methyltransferase
MTDLGYSLFETPVGRCGIVWNDRGIAGVLLPESKDALTRARVTERYPDAREAKPPSTVKRAIDQILALLDGKPARLDTIALDMTRVPPFHRKVYEAARAVGPGSTLSYGDIAERVGSPGAARAVGQALKKNPFAIIVPCHRVLASGGKIGGFTANGGISTKQRLLSLEGTQLAKARRAERDPAAELDAAIAVAHLRKVDPTLGKLIDRIGPYRLEVEATSNLFAALARTICYQQLTGKAAATIFGRVCELFPGRRLSAEKLLEIPDSALRAAGLSGSKLLSLRDLARRTLAGELPTLAEARRLPNEELVERLTVVRGIGRWSVEMLLIFRLGRPDVLPLDDYGIKKGFAVAFKKSELPSGKELEARGLRWRPYRSVASWYLWRAAELPKK